MTRDHGLETAMSMDVRRAALMGALARGRICAADVAHLRRDLFSDGIVTRDEADALFAVECAAIWKCPEWTSFFVEAITAHVVWQSRPTGVVNEGQGEWLIAQCDRAASLNALAALVNVLGEAHRAPGWFVSAVRARGAKKWAGVEAAFAAVA